MACLERPSPGQESKRTHPKTVCVSEASGETAAESGTEQTTFQPFSLEKALGWYLLRSKVILGSRSREEMSKPQAASLGTILSHLE